jgi:hypothetical protein
VLPRHCGLPSFRGSSGLLKTAPYNIMEKKYVKQFLGSFSLCDIEGDVDDAIEFLGGYKELAKDKGCIRVYLNETGWDLPYIEVMGERFETDAELKKRQKKSEASKKSAKTRKDRLKAARRQQYEKLKKEFEN